VSIDGRDPRFRDAQLSPGRVERSVAHEKEDFYFVER